MKQLFLYDKDYGGVKRTSVYETLKHEYQENTVDAIREYLGALTELLVDRGIISHGDVLRALPVNKYTSIHCFDGMPFYSVSGGRDDGYVVTETIVTTNPNTVHHPFVNVSALPTECDLQWADAKEEADQLNRNIKD